MKGTFAWLALSILLASLETAAAPEMRGAKVQLQNGMHVVVEEGSSEPRSIGSYTVLYYSGVNSRFPTDSFLAGIVLSRDGSIERVEAIDLDGDGTEEIVVVIRSAGSGGYLQVDVVTYSKKGVSRVASLSDLDPDSDVVRLLQAEMKKGD